MADREIKTRIVLEGEKQYKQALADINRQLRESKSAVSAAAAEYQAAAGSERTTAEQTGALNEMLERQREKLALMQAELKRVEEEYGANSREAVTLRTSINTTRAEMAKTQTQLRGLTDGLQAAGDAGDSLGEGMEDTAAGLDRIGESAQEAAGDVRGLAGEIGDVIGQKVIEFALGQKALDALKEGLSFSIGEAIDAQAEHAWMLANAGNAELTAAREEAQAIVDRLYAGRMDGMATAGAVTAVDTALGNISQTDPERLAEITNQVIMLQQAFGKDLQGSIDNTKTLMNTFGITAEEALDLITKGLQDSGDGGDVMNTALEKGAQLFDQMGYSADQMIGTLINLSQNEELGKDGNLITGMQTLLKTVTDGGKESKEVLEALGIEATDLPLKLQTGGEAAEAAMRLLLDSLLSIQDEAKRNELGKALFGDTVWTATGGDIAKALLDGYSQTIQADGTAAAATKALTDNLSDSLAGLGERAAQSMGKAMEPLADAANDAIKRINEEIDLAGGSFLEGMGNAISGMITEAFAVNDAVEAARKAGADVGAAYVDSYRETLQNAEISLAPVSASVDDILTLSAATDDPEITAQASAAVEAAAHQALEDARSGKTQLTIDDLFQMTSDAAGAGDLELYQRLSDITEAVLTGVRDIATVGMDEVTGEATQASMDAIVSDKPAMRRTAEGYAQEAVDAILDAADDAYDAGDELGSEGNSGADDGLGDGGSLGTAFGGGVASGILSKIGDVYRAGQQLGAAGSAGVRNTLQIHSPSRVGLMLGDNFGGSVSDGVLRREDDAYAAGRQIAEALENGYDAPNAQAYALGAGISEAFAGGYGARMTATAAPDAAPAVDAESIGAAVRDALGELEIVIDGERVGVLVSGGVSRAIAQKSAQTASGRGAQVRSW